MRLLANGNACGDVVLLTSDSSALVLYLIQCIYQNDTEYRHPYEIVRKLKCSMDFSCALDGSREPVERQVKSVE